LIVGIKSAGDLASGVAWRLHHCGLRVFMTEVDRPLAVRRKVAFSEAVYDGKAIVQGVEGLLVHGAREALSLWEQGKIPVMVDPRFELGRSMAPDVVVDAILAKRNMGTSIHDAPVVIALGPGFEVMKHCHFIVETNRGHNLGRLLTEGAAEPNTGVPGAIQGIAGERVLRAPADGTWRTPSEIGRMVKKGEVIGDVAGSPVEATIDGVLRGLIRPGIPVNKGLKIGDIDPRGIETYCHTISEKALAVAGGVLEGVFRAYGA
jgi:xanthine dehydrogenase accessory factor